MSIGRGYIDRSIDRVRKHRRKQEASATATTIIANVYFALLCAKHCYKQETTM